MLSKKNLFQKKVGEIIQRASGKIRNEDFAVVSNPEFLREGEAIRDFRYPDRVVIGSNNKKNLLTFLKEIYLVLSLFS